MTTIYNPSNTQILLHPDAVRAILASQEEGCPECIGYYGSLQELATKLCGSMHWALGQVFVFAESDSRFIVMKQIAPDSSEWLTLSARGYEDVLSANLFAPEDLEATLQSYLDQTKQRWFETEPAKVP